jgi:hypothetical protein
MAISCQPSCPSCWLISARILSLTRLDGLTSIPPSYPAAVCEGVLRLNVRRFQRHVVLLRVSPLMAEYLLQEIGPLAGRHRRFVLDRLIVVQLRIELTAEDHMAGKSSADFQFDRLAVSPRRAAYGSFHRNRARANTPSVPTQRTRIALVPTTRPVGSSASTSSLLNLRSNGIATPTGAKP